MVNTSYNTPWYERVTISVGTCSWKWIQVTLPRFVIDMSFIGQQVMKFVCMCFHIIEIFFTYTVTSIFQSLQANITQYFIIT